MKPRDIEVRVDFRHGEYLVSVQRIAKVTVECSNNRWQFSSTDPSQQFVFQEVPQYTVNSDDSAVDEVVWRSVLRMIGTIPN